MCLEPADHVDFTNPRSMAERRNQSNSFVLRIWWDEGNAQPIWRGWVQHARSGETRYFERLADLLAFVETYTESLAQAPDVRSGELEESP